MIGHDSREVPWIVSVDDHVIEPPHVWQSWLPERFRDRGPRVVRDGSSVEWVEGNQVFRKGGDGPTTDWWVYEDLEWCHQMLNACAGYDESEWWMGPIGFDEMREGCYDVKARLDDMDRNHVQASLCFPTFPRFCGQVFAERADKELALACVRAYNDWMIEEWCEPSDGYNIPLGIIPLWDPQLAAEEVERNAARGMHAICFSEIPPRHGLPSIHTQDWDPLFAACDQNDVTLCMHIGSSSTMPAASPDSPEAVGGTLAFNNAMASMADWLFSGKMITFPNLKLAYSEGQIGWIPYALERADTVWDHHDAWQHTKERIPEPPSTYYWGRIFGCFTADRHGLANLASVGEDNICFETDYPHTDTTWPFSREYAEKMVTDLSDDVAYKVLRGNAITMLSLDRV
jgi:predicted TIM-barrel fold metal-dependent hydrolase